MGMQLESNVVGTGFVQESLLYEERGISVALSGSVGPRSWGLQSVRVSLRPQSSEALPWLHYSGIVEQELQPRRLLFEGIGPPTWCP